VGLAVEPYSGALQWNPFTVGIAVGIQGLTAVGIAVGCLVGEETLVSRVGILVVGVLRRRPRQRIFVGVAVCSSRLLRFLRFLSLPRSGSIFTTGAANRTFLPRAQICSYEVSVIPEPEAATEISSRGSA
jgi:hypothetical protein